MRELLHPRFGWSSHAGERLDLDSYVHNTVSRSSWRGQHFTEVLHCVGSARTYRMPMTQTWVRESGHWRQLAGHAGRSSSPSRHNGVMVSFRTPQIILFTRDIDRAVRFYTAVGFVEVFRTPATGAAIHVDLRLDDYRIGLATEESTRNDHGLDPIATGQRAAVILWTDDTVGGLRRLVELGARQVKGPEPWLGRLLIAWVEDPDGHLVQVVQNVG